jgi:site-specific recombinase XerC
MDTCGLERVERFRVNLNEKNFAPQKNILTYSLPERCRAVGTCGSGNRLLVNVSRIRATAKKASNSSDTGRSLAAVRPLNYPAHWFVPAVRAATIRSYKWHDNRHTYASRLRQTEAALGNLAEVRGHKRLAVTRRYADLSTSNLNGAAFRIASDAPVASEPAGEKSEVVYVR